MYIYVYKYKYIYTYKIAQRFVTFLKCNPSAFQNAKNLSWD